MWVQATEGTGHADPLDATHSAAAKVAELTDSRVALPGMKEMARPTGVGRELTAYRMPIEGCDEWLAAAKRQA